MRIDAPPNLHSSPALRGRNGNTGRTLTAAIAHTMPSASCACTRKGEVASLSNDIAGQAPPKVGSFSVITPRIDRVRSVVPTHADAVLEHVDDPREEREIRVTIPADHFPPNDRNVTEPRFMISAVQVSLRRGDRGRGRGLATCRRRGDRGRGRAHCSAVRLLRGGDAGLSPSRQPAIQTITTASIDRFAAIISSVHKLVIIQHRRTMTCRCAGHDHPRDSAPQRRAKSRALVDASSSHVLRHCTTGTSRAAARAGACVRRGEVGTAAPLGRCPKTRYTVPAKPAAVQPPPRLTSGGRRRHGAALRAAVGRRAEVVAGTSGRPVGRRIPAVAVGLGNTSRRTPGGNFRTRGRCAKAHTQSTGRPRAACTN